MHNTLKYGDRIINTKVAQFHVLHITAVQNFIHFNVRKNIVSEFISQGHNVMKCGASNLSHKSDICVISRGSNLGAERTHIESRESIL